MNFKTICLKILKSTLKIITFGCFIGAYYHSITKSTNN